MATQTMRNTTVTQDTRPKAGRVESDLKEDLAQAIEVNPGRMSAQVRSLRMDICEHARNVAESLNWPICPRPWWYFFT